MVQVNRADGLGVAEIKKMGIKQIIISTEKNPVVSARANKLDIHCFQGIDSKKDKLLKYCQEININLSQVAYVGNDINDYDAMAISGFAFCPADAHQNIKEIADHILLTNGGNGVIRELFDVLLFGD